MRIAVLASVAHSAPPRAYGPWELIAWLLAEGLMARGHEVTLAATADSVTSARLLARVATGYEESDEVHAEVARTLHLAALFEQAGEFDVISNHFDFPPLAFSRLVSTPMVTTIHGFSSPAIVPVFRHYDDIAHYVAISEADRHPDLTYAATIHHGIPVSRMAFGHGEGGYLVALGRIHPDKGTHAAIEIARRAGLPLRIAGIIHDADYFRDLVAPHLDGVQVDYLGDLAPGDRDRLLADALALLHPIAFAEPFGLAVIESLAVGTPVIAMPRGSMPEIIRHGITGFLAPTVDAAVDAVRRVGHLDRAACRADAESRFDVTRMVADYERVLTEVVHGRG